MKYISALIVLCLATVAAAAPTLDNALTARVGFVPGSSVDGAVYNVLPPTAAPAPFAPYVDGNMYQVGAFSAHKGGSIISVEVCMAVAGYRQNNEFGYVTGGVFNSLMSGGLPGATFQMIQPEGQDWKLAFRRLTSPVVNVGSSIDSENAEGAFPFIVGQRVNRDGAVLLNYSKLPSGSPSPYTCNVKSGDFLIFIEDQYPSTGSDRDHNDIVLILRQTPKLLCQGPSGGTVSIGQQVSAMFTGFNKNLNETLTAALTGPAGSSLAPTSGTSPLNSVFNWTVQANQAGQTIPVSVKFSDPAGRNVTCSTQYTVRPNLPPFCAISGSYQNLQCQGALTTVTVLSSSVDPDGQVLTHTWGTTCSGATITPVGAGTSATLGLTIPGTGQPQSCAVTLTVSDGVNSRSCQAPVSASPCNLDCLNQPNGEAVLDECGVCNGNNSCFDCAGQPNGGKVVDRCGVCGGNNSCVDCADVPNGTSKVDDCGVCGGDNSSCTSCSETNQANALIILDGNANSQKAVNVNIAKELERVSKLSSVRKQTKKARERSNELYLINWQTTWNIPATVNACEGPNAANCQTVNAQSQLDYYLTNSVELLKIANDMNKTYKKVGNKASAASKSRMRKYIQRAQRLHQNNLAVSKTVKTTTLVCPTPQPGK